MADEEGIARATAEGWTERDPPLTPRGEAQAARLQDHALLAALPRPLLVVASPLRRTLQTATLACSGEGVRLVANSDLQETTTLPCDTGRPTELLAKEFPDVDFGEISGSAWVEKEPPDHDDTGVRLDRFLRWCAARPEASLVVVTHQNVCRTLLGVLLDNCDVLGVSLDRATLECAPLAYVGITTETLRWTCTKGTGEGIKFLVVDKARAMTRLDVGGGWPMLHFAAGCGNLDTVKALLEIGAHDVRASCGYRARAWAASSGWDDVVALLDAHEEEREAWWEQHSSWSGRPRGDGGEEAAAA